MTDDGRDEERVDGVAVLDDAARSIEPRGDGGR